MKPVKTIIIVNDGDGNLRLIVSDDTCTEEGQNGIDFDLPPIGKDIGFSVGDRFELEEQSPPYRLN